MQKNLQTLLIQCLDHTASVVSVDTVSRRNRFSPPKMPPVRNLFTGGEDVEKQHYNKHCDGLANFCATMWDLLCMRGRGHEGRTVISQAFHCMCDHFLHVNVSESWITPDSMMKPPHTHIFCYSLNWHLVKKHGWGWDCWHALPSCWHALLAAGMPEVNKWWRHLDEDL